MAFCPQQAKFGLPTPSGRKRAYWVPRLAGGRFAFAPTGLTQKGAEKGDNLTRENRASLPIRAKCGREWGLVSGTPVRSPLPGLDCFAPVALGCLYLHAYIPLLTFRASAFGNHLLESFASVPGGTRDRALCEPGSSCRAILRRA